MSASSTGELYRQALDLYERDEFDAAGERLEEVLRAEPHHAEALYKLGNVRKAQGDLAGAAGHYRRLLERQPGHAEALNNLGALCQGRGEDQEAERCYRLALQNRPGLAQPYLNLGRMLQTAGRMAEAASLYGAALAQGLDAEVFGHLLAASDGAPSPRAPESYVRATFDAFAPEFEQRLAELGYEVPQRLAALVARHTAGGRPMQVLDLGCGTGLAGEALGATVRHLVGVDLSPKMLQSAARKRHYTELHEADILAWLDGESARFDLVLAADVFIYIGDLGPLFQGIVRCLRPGGLLGFSVELCAGGSYRLLPSGRYAQSPAYLGQLAGQWGLEVLEREALEIRAGIAGEIYLMRLV